MNIPKYYIILIKYIKIKSLEYFNILINMLMDISHLQNTGDKF